MSNSPFATIEISDPQLEHDLIRHFTVFSPALGRRADPRSGTALGDIVIGRRIRAS